MLYEIIVPKYLTVMMTIKLLLFHSKKDVLSIEHDVEDWLTRIDWRLIVEESVPSLLAVSLLSTMQSCDGCNYSTFIRPNSLPIAGQKTLGSRAWGPRGGMTMNSPLGADRHSKCHLYILLRELLHSHFLKCSRQLRHARIIISCAVEFK